MRKIPMNLENPIDNVFIGLSCHVGPFFKKLNFTPNGITTLSLITGLLSIFFLYKGWIWLTVSMYILSYFFDCLDGWYARKYDMCTKFGDKYDHFKDWTVFILYVSVLFIRNKHKLTTGQWTLVIFLAMLLFSCNALYFACQEKYYDKLDQIPSMKWIGNIIKDKDKSVTCLKWLRFFGVGTFVVTLLFFTIYIEMK